MSRLRPLAPGLGLRGYRLVSQLGVGGDGEVWLARDGRGQEVALKARPMPSRAEASILFREFEHLRTLRIPSVVRVLDAGIDQGYVFFTMDVARGQELDQHVQAGDSLRERVLRTARVGAGVADALAAIHRLGLAHNDIKPANILVEADGRVTLLDFGTAHFGPAGSPTELRGTVAYMAPEQRAGHPHDHRADLYSLGVTLYEALSGTPARHFGPTQPRPSLMRLGSEVGPRLDWMLRSMLALDPAERPTAEEVQGELTVLAEEGGSAREAPWPAPSDYVGKLPPLLEGRAVVVGAPGTGRRRTVQEARRQWFRKGYRSIAGACRADLPFAPLRQLLGELLSGGGSASLEPEELQLLHAIAPELPVPEGTPEPWPPDPFATARALGAVLQRQGPVALVLWDLDQADIGSLAVLAALLPQLGPEVRVWATARRPVLSLPPRHPPPWTGRHEAAVLEDLLGEVGRRPPRPARTPLQSCARAWRRLAHSRALRGPTEELPQALADLTVLRRPFPQEVAQALVEAHGETSVRALLEAGHLTWATLASAGAGGEGGAGPAIGEEDPDTERTAPFLPTHLDFADPTTARLAEALVEDPVATHRRAARAWAASSPSAERLQEVARHEVCAGRPSQDALDAVILLEAQRGAASEVERWLRLRDLHEGVEDRFHIAYARLYAALELRPRRVGLADLRALAAQAGNSVERGLAAYLRLIHEARRGDPDRAVALGRRWVKALQREQPAIAAQMVREVGLAELGRGRLEEAIDHCERSLSLARRAARRPVGATPEITAALVRSSGGSGELPLTPAEIGAGTTLSAALLYSGRTREAVRLCHDLAQRCRRAGQARGEGALRANEAIGLFNLGERARAAEACSAARAVQGRHHDPIVLAHIALMEARLAVERGEHEAARKRIDEALTTGRSAGHARVQAEAWSLVLEAATHTLDPAEAQRALAAYGTEGLVSSRDPFPAVLARWRWLVGDLEGALQAVCVPREGHGGLCVRAEQARLHLVAGRYEEAGRQALAVQDAAEAAEYAELALFAELVGMTARGSADEAFLPVLRRTERSRWVHLYLGGLHLDAIRRQLRGENVRPVVRRLHRRASELGHQLYRGLARVEAW